MAQPDESLALRGCGIGCGILVLISALLGFSLKHCGSRPSDERNPAGFSESAVTLQKARAPNGKPAYIIRNDSDTRLAQIRIMINYKNFTDYTGIEAHDAFYIPVAEAQMFTQHRPVTHIGLHASVGRDRKHWHWELPVGTGME